MDNIDDKLKLLSGSSFQIDNLTLKPFTLKEIKNVGYNYYFRKLNFFMININDLIDINQFDEGLQLNLFDIIINSNVSELINEFSEAIKLFFRKNEIFVDIPNNIIHFDKNKNKQINRNNYNQIVDILKMQHCIKQDEIETYNDDRARAIAEKLKKANNKINKIKNNDDEIGNFPDLISAVCSKSHNINLINVWNLTLYQFYDHFNRLNIIDNYDISIHCMIQGAKDIQLKHWSSKINNN